MIEKTPTGISGLDEMLQGGIPKGYTVLVTGGPGCGKSTLAMHFLVNGVELYNENGIYITFEESPRDIIRNFSQYGWDLSKIMIIGIIAKKSTFVPAVKYIDREVKEEGKNYKEYTPKKFSVEMIREVITKHVEELNAKRLVIDSLPALALYFSDESEIRQEVLGLVNMLSELNCTSLLLTEMPMGEERISRFGIEEYLVHGVIALYNIRKGSERVRGLEILKMRGTKHSKRICLMEIGDGGIEIYPSENLYTEG